MIQNEKKCDDKKTDTQEIQSKFISYNAVLSLAIGVLSIFLAFLSFKSGWILIPFGLSVLVAPIFGITALIQISRRGCLFGRSIAIFGICASPVSVVCFFSYWITHFTLPT